MKLKQSFFVMTVLLLSACGSSNEDFSGTFVGTDVGTQNGTPFTTTLSVTLKQDGSNIYGNWSNDAGSSGTVSALAKGSSAESFAISASAGCLGALSGSAILEGSRLKGTLSGTTNCGDISGTFDLARK